MRLPADDAVTRTIVERLLADATRGGVKKTVDEVLPVFRDLMDDPMCDKLVRRMDENGTDVTAICVVDNAGMGFDDDRILRYNELCAGAAAAHPDRLIALAGIDPRRPQAPALFRKCLEDFGMKGLKWHPDDGYYPNSPEAYAVLKVAAEHGVPLLTHCSPLPSSRAKYAAAIHLDDVAVDIPGLEIIAAHMGNLWWRDWLAIAQYKEKVSGDMAMWQLLAIKNQHLFRRYLREILDILGPDQVLFATDGPVFEAHISNGDWIAVVQCLVGTGNDGLVFTQEEVDAILGGNAARIFKLPA
jgi:predicted TIM-barrel fold metal-dependent hydrolase